MKRDIAERLAATDIGDITAAQVGTIVREFFGYLVKCAGCDGSGVIEFAHDANILVRNGDLQDKFIPAGTAITCPHCGGRDAQGRRRHDPEYVFWYCVNLNTTNTVCRADSAPDANKHPDCGYRVMLPVPPAKTEDTR